VISWDSRALIFFLKIRGISLFWAEKALGGGEFYFTKMTLWMGYGDFLFFWETVDGGIFRDFMKMTLGMGAGDLYFRGSLGMGEIRSLPGCGKLWGPFRGISYD